MTSNYARRGRGLPAGRKNHGPKDKRVHGTTKDTEKTLLTTRIVISSNLRGCPTTVTRQRPSSILWSCPDHSDQEELSSILQSCPDHSDQAELS